MIEILVGLGIITTALVVSLVVVTHSSRLSRASRNKLEATRYAETVLETLRSTRDQDKASFFTNGTCPVCGPFGTGVVYSCALSCSFSPAPPNATRDDVTVTISWDDGGSTASILVPTTLTLYDL